MCSEKDPTNCHRHLLIGRVLAERRISLLHIRGDGSIQKGEELASLDESPSYEQGELWSVNNDRGVKEWRSIRSVLRRKQQPNSSEQ
jgi:hypothetical protein